MKNVVRKLRKLKIKGALAARIFLVLVVCSITVSLSAKKLTIQSGVELEALNNTLLPGDTVVMKKGMWLDQKLNFYANGTIGLPIVLIAEEKDGVVLSGESRLSIFGEYLEVNGLRFEGGYSHGDAVVSFRKSSSELAENCRLTNTTIKDYNPENKDTDYKWVSVYGSHNRIDHCAFSGKEHSGTTLVVWIGDEPNYTQIDHNYFGLRPDLGYNGGETIRIGTSTNSMKESRAIVEYNLFEECDGEIEIISNKSCFNTYRYNTFNDCDGCLTLRHGNDCSVYGNFFFGDNKSSGGVRIIGERHQVYNNYFEGLRGDDYRSAICIMNGVPNSPLNRYFQVQDAVVAFNTIVNCKMPLTVGAGKDSEKSLAPLNCSFCNNVMDATIGSQNVELEDQPINMTWLGNVMNADSDDEEVSEGFIFANPDLEKVDYLYRPSAKSILIDASKGNYPQVDSDIDGQAREGIKDVGCDEQSESSITNKPLDENEVGPYSGKDDNVSNVSDGLRLSMKMVNCTLHNGVLSFSVEEVKYFPIHYRVYNITGKLISTGEITDSQIRININRTNRMLLACFYSGKQYYQSQKLLQNNAI